MQTSKPPKPPRKPRPPAKWRPTTPTKKQIARGNKFLAPAIALAFVLASSAVWGEQTDYVLTVREHGVDVLWVCAKSQRTCEEAREAIRTQRWPIADPGVQPHDHDQFQHHAPKLATHCITRVISQIASATMTSFVGTFISCTPSAAFVTIKTI